MPLSVFVIYCIPFGTNMAKYYQHCGKK